MIDITQEQYDRIKEKAEAYDFLILNGKCDGKHGSGVSIGNSLKADLEFRFWGSPEKADGLIKLKILKGRQCQTT